MLKSAFLREEIVKKNYRKLNRWKIIPSNRRISPLSLEKSERRFMLWGAVGYCPPLTKKQATIKYLRSALASAPQKWPFHWHLLLWCESPSWGQKLWANIPLFCPFLPNFDVVYLFQCCECEKIAQKSCVFCENFNPPACLFLSIIFLVCSFLSTRRVPFFQGAYEYSKLFYWAYSMQLY